MPKRFKTDYPGVFYREADRIGGKGTEKVYYVVYKKKGRVIESKAGRQYVDDMTPAKASRYRGDLIEGKQLTPVKKREMEKAKKAEAEGRWTINRLWKEYKKNRIPGKSLGTDIGRYEKYLKKPFGNKEPNQIVPLDVDRIRISLLKKKSPQTVKHVLNLFTWIVNYGVKKGLCDGLKFHVQKPTVNNIKTEDLTPDQLKKLLDAIEVEENIQIANLIKMALYTGMRRGELFKLKWSHINYDRGFISIVDPKGGPDQKIPINDTVRDLLKNHPKTSKFIFPGRDGRQRVSSVGVNEVKKRAGLPDDFRPLHGLRHVFASNLASSGEVDLYTLQKLLTHKSPIMTQRYAHLRDEALKRASDLAGDIINNTIKNVKGKAASDDRE